MRRVTNKFAFLFLLTFSGLASATNVQFVGSVGYSDWGTNSVVLTASRIQNYESGGVSGSLYMKLWACLSPSIPSQCYDVASFSLGQLDNSYGQLAGGAYYYGVSSGTLSATTPPNGTYYMIMALVEYPNLSTAIDSVTLDGTVTISSGGSGGGGGGGGGSGVDEYGNTLGAAYAIAPNSTISGVVNSTSDLDFFRINLTSRGQLALRTNGTTDTVGTLYTSAGTIVALNDDGCNNGLNFCLSQTLNAGTYYVRVHGLNTGAYSLVSRFTPAVTTTAADDYGNTRATARAIAPNSTTSGRINSGTDVDFFRVRLTRAGALSLRTRGTTDTVGTLYNAAGTRIGAVSDDTCNDGTRNFCIRRSLAAGTYYLKVDGYSTTRTGPYSLVSTFR